MSDAQRYQQAVKQLRRELESRQFRRAAPERAFIDWYVLARYGKNAKCEIVDGPGDGGIDAIVTEGATRVLLQSKYEPSLKLRTVPAKELSHFEDTAATFTGSASDLDFHAWLADVRPELRTRYKALRRMCVGNPQSVRFDFVTSKRVAAAVTDPLHVIDIERVAALWYLYEEGFTPPVESVAVEFEEVWGRGGKEEKYRNYIGLADVRVLLDLMDEDEHERLFAQNVRTDLRTRINTRIRESYEKEPDLFWLGNNGIYIVCSRADMRGQSLNLVYPSIINGSQTLHALHASRKRHRCRILIRVLEMDVLGERELLSAIVRRTNTQNPMRAMNLAAHDPEQLNVARYLDGASVFYERREREWMNEKRFLLTGYVPVGMKDVAQWIAVCRGLVGIGTARSKVGTLFNPPDYKRVFGTFGEDFGTSAYAVLCRSILAGLIARRGVRRLSATQRGQARIVHLLLVKAIESAISTSARLRGEALELLGERSYKQIGDAAGVRNELRRILTNAVSAQRRAARADAGMDLSNYFKRDDHTAEAYRVAVPARTVNALHTAMERAAFY